MDSLEFITLRGECNAAAETFFREAEKTSLLLAKCARDPLAFEERFAILTQEIRESDAYRLYLDAKRILHSAALQGYGALAAN